MGGNLLVHSIIELNMLSQEIQNKIKTSGRIAINDAFIEILSKTTRAGNSLKAPVEALHTYGAIPADAIPLKEGMTWEEYMNPARVTEEHKKLGKEFLKRISIGFEQVHPTSFVQALKDDMLDVAGYAWPVPENGVYPRVEGATFNHAFMLANDSINAFDNYVPYVKLLAKDYKFFDWCYSISITNQNPYPEEVLTLFEVLQRKGLLAFFADAVKRLFSTAPIHEDYPPKPNVQGDIAKAAEEAVGTDLSPQNLAPQELSCAEGLSNLIHAIVVDILPRMISTIELKNSLDDCKKFDRVLKPKRGTIIVSPRIGNTPGHCGIFVNEKDIISNDSKTGTMQKNYTYSSWVGEMFVRRKLHIYFWDFI